jgi:S-adenosylmethionine synthetase
VEEGDSDAERAPGRANAVNPVDLRTAESVTEGHPDKVCDVISDAVLDEVLAQDPWGRCACEVLLTRGIVIVAGEISTAAVIDADDIGRGVISDVGYRSSAMGLDADACGVLSVLHNQSVELNDALDAGGANDQALVFGYAGDETAELMPMPIWLAHRLARRLADVRKDGRLPYLRPDGKVQVTIGYVNGRPATLERIVVAAQHDPDIDEGQLRADLHDHVVRPVVPATLDGAGLHLTVNSPGPFTVGGPAADTGLTGRKIVVDSYGGAAPHGGGALSGKDPSKIDRSAAYGARWIAKHVVGAGLARRCLVQLAYAIGVPDPVVFSIETDGTGALPESALETAVHECFKLTPRGFVADLDLRRPIYTRTASYGHFGRTDIDLSWERLDRVDDLRQCAERQ